jgi:hypothetical protein
MQGRLPLLFHRTIITGAQNQHFAWTGASSRMGAGNCLRADAILKNIIYKGGASRIRICGPNTG